MAKTIKQLQEENARLTAELAEAKKASTSEKDDKQLAEIKEQLEKATSALETATAERDAAVAKASLTEKERSFIETLDEDNAAEFIKMNVKARAAFMKTAEDTDEVIEVSGATVRKSVVGDAAFEMMKAQEARLSAMEKKANEERETRIITEITKRIETELNHIPGTVDEKIDVLKAISGLDEGVRKSLDAILKAADSALSDNFRDFGVKDGSVAPLSKARSRIGDENSDFMQKVAKIRDTEKVTNSEAMTRARKRYPEEYEDFSGRASA